MLMDYFFQRKVCLASTSPPTFHFVLVNSLHKIITNNPGKPGQEIQNSTAELIKGLVQLVPLTHSAEHSQEAMEKMPFTGPLLGGLREGKSVIVIGRILPTAGRFYVNLQCGSESNADIALHFNPRFDELSTVVLNTLQNSSWGSEECKSDSFLLQNQPFILQILVTKDTYKISINGKYFVDYKHRIPFSRVDTIVVNKLMDMDFIGYQNPEVVPYKAVINGGLQPEKDIVVYGVPNPDSKIMTFNLRHRYGVAFHYKSLFEENVVVRNTFENGKWGAEERSGALPFKKDQLFQVTISCNKEQFTVCVNGQQAHTYKHRYAKLEDIDVFEFYGDMQLFFVKI